MQSEIFRSVFAVPGDVSGSDPGMSSFDRTKSDRPISAAIIEAVAEEAAVDPTELPPLYESVDVDAIDELFEPTPNANGRVGVIRFPYYGYLVTVEFDADGTGTITIESTDSKR